MEVVINKLCAALRDAEAGLIVAKALGACKCSGDFRCTPCKGLDSVKYALNGHEPEEPR